MRLPVNAHKLKQISLLLGSIVRSCSSLCSTAQTNFVFYFNDLNEQPLPLTHGFPMKKYRLVREG